MCQKHKYRGLTIFLGDNLHNMRFVMYAKVYMSASKFSDSLRVNIILNTLPEYELRPSVCRSVYVRLSVGLSDRHFSGLAQREARSAAHISQREAALSA
jgi:hypothetical protein